jgi:hypothetical protein
MGADRSRPRLPYVSGRVPHLWKSRFVYAVRSLDSDNFVQFD